MSLVVPDDEAGRQRAIDVLRGGGIVGLPTDTVYGIAVALATPEGIERLFAAKRRPPERGIVLLLAEAEQASAIATVTPPAAALGRAFWPGGLSLVLPQRADAGLPAILTGGAPTIGVRLPDHPAPRALAAVLGPLPTTSANRSGEPELRTAADIAATLRDAVALVLDGGPAAGGPASTVVDCTRGDEVRVLRAGAIASSAIEEAVAAIGARVVE